MSGLTRFSLSLSFELAIIAPRLNLGYDIAAQDRRLEILLEMVVAGRDVTVVGADVKAESSELVFIASSVWKTSSDEDITR